MISQSNQEWSKFRVRGFSNHKQEATTIKNGLGSIDKTIKMKQMGRAYCDPVDYINMSNFPMNRSSKIGHRSPDDRGQEMTE